MGAHGNLPLLGEAGDRRWLARGIATGAGAMIAAVLVAMVFITAVIGDAGQGWAERGTLTAVLFTALWAMNAAGAGRHRRVAGGRERRPPHRGRALRRRLRPGRADRARHASPRWAATAPRRVTVLVEGIVEVAAAVAGADALARRLEAGW